MIFPINKTYVLFQGKDTSNFLFILFISFLHLGSRIKADSSADQ